MSKCALMCPCREMMTRFDSHCESRSPVILLILCKSSAHTWQLCYSQCASEVCSLVRLIFIRFILYVASLVGLSAPSPSSSASLKHGAQRRDQTCHCHRYRDAPCSDTLRQRPLCSGTPTPFPDAFTHHLPGGAEHRVTVTQHALSFFFIENE